VKKAIVTLSIDELSRSLGVSAEAVLKAAREMGVEVEKSGTLDLAWLDTFKARFTPRDENVIVEQRNLFRELIENASRSREAFEKIQSLHAARLDEIQRRYARSIGEAASGRDRVLDSVTRAHAALAPLGLEHRLVDAESTTMMPPGDSNSTLEELVTAAASTISQMEEAAAQLRALRDAAAREAARVRLEREEQERRKRAEEEERARLAAAEKRRAEEERREEEERRARLAAQAESEKREQLARRKRLLLTSGAILIVIVTGVVVVTVWERGRAARYQLALEERGVGHLAEARTIFESIKGYRNARELGATIEKEMLYEAARVATQHQDYVTAFEKLSELVNLDPEYRDAKEFLERTSSESSYWAAVEALKKNQWASALNLLAELERRSPNFRNTRRLLRQLRSRYERPPSASDASAPLAVPESGTVSESPTDPAVPEATAETPASSEPEAAASISTSGSVSAEVFIYSDANYRGASQRLAPGRYDLRDIMIGNDQVSSVLVPSGWRVTLYEHAGFKGYSRVYTTDTYFTRDMNDAASSIIVEGPRSASSENAEPQNAEAYEGAWVGGAQDESGPATVHLELTATGNALVGTIRIDAPGSATVVGPAHFRVDHDDLSGTFGFSYQERGTSCEVNAGIHGTITTKRLSGRFAGANSCRRGRDYQGRMDLHRP
jgi:hypothetical protein